MKFPIAKIFKARASDENNNVRSSSDQLSSHLRQLGQEFLFGH